MKNIKFQFSSTKNWSTKEKAKEFAKLLLMQNNFFTPEKFDYAQPEKHLFNETNFVEFVEIWQRCSGISLSRKRPYGVWFLVTDFYRQYKVFNTIIGNFDEESLSLPKNIESILLLAKNIYAWGNLDHAYICHRNDRDNKNYFGKPTETASGFITSTGGLRLNENLPGIYWCNIFGPTYVNFIGKDKFASTPAYYKEQLPGGGYLLLTSSSPLDYQSPEVKVLEKAIIDHLGRDLFFEKSNPLKKCIVPEFSFEQEMDPNFNK